jgi:predicted metal-dependent hydrolase
MRSRSSFPAGEQFFIRSVQCFRDGLTDPTLRRQVKEFAYQEAQHSNAHAAFNAHLADQRLTLGWVEKSLRLRLDFANAWFSDVQRLAFTAAAEHLTATMAEGLLASRHDHLADADPRMRALYLWHAVEEVEHKAVSWDVYERVAHGGWLRRILAHVWMTGIVAVNVAVVVTYLLWKDGLLFDLGTWRRSLPRLWGRQGLFTRMVRPYLRGFRRRFHPWTSRPPHGFAEFVQAYGERPDIMTASNAALGAAA